MGVARTAGHRLGMKYFASVALTALMAAPLCSCKVEDRAGDGLCSLLGPCLNHVTYPDYYYTVMGLPASKVANYVAFLSPGDSVSLYFVRYRPFDKCGDPIDTIRTDGVWTVTQPFGGPPDSSVATITRMPN